MTANTYGTEFLMQQARLQTHTRSRKTLVGSKGQRQKKTLNNVDPEVVYPALSTNDINAVLRKGGVRYKRQ